MPFYEQGADDLGEITQRGLRYRLYFDRERRLTISVLVPGQHGLPGMRPA